MSIETVIFDLDGVIIETEQVWHAVRRDFALAHGGRWDYRDQPAVMGANSLQWAAYMREKSGVQLTDQKIYDEIVQKLRERYANDLPLVPGAPEAVAGLALKYRLGVASSSPRELIEYALTLAGLRGFFDAVVSSDEVSRGKPAPDVYLRACALLRTHPCLAVAVEDSSSGIQSAAAAGLAVIAIPNTAFPPSSETVGLADMVLGSIAELTVEMVSSIDVRLCDQL